MDTALTVPHNSHATLDWVLASTLVGGAYAFHVDMAMANQYLAAVGGLLGIALAGSRLYFFLKEKLGTKQEWNQPGSE